MSDFKNTTRTVMGHHHWGGGSIGGASGTGGTINHLARGGPVLDKIDANPGHAEVFPKGGNRMTGNSAVQRENPPTEELVEHGGKTPLTSGYKKGGPAKHFHVHKHFHAKGGKIETKSSSYRSVERSAEGFAEGGHVHDCTSVPAQGPDYKKGGHAKKPARKNAGGAMYAPGGLVAGAPVRPVATTPAVGGARLTAAANPLAAKAPVGLPVRQAPPMRKPMTMPGAQPVMRAQGGTVGMKRVAKAAVDKHVRTPKPRGHGIK